jgi:predicted enzyme related to lactoylglutathione lyase
MLNLNNVMLGTEDATGLAEFYEKVIGKKADMSEEGSWYGWTIGSAFLSIGAHSEVKGKASQPQRIILNFETTDVKGEFERIQEAGAEVIKEPYEMQGAWIATLADPDGNYFQLMTPWNDEKELKN